jgi:hypothetical protein
MNVRARSLFTVVLAVLGLSLAAAPAVANSLLDLQMTRVDAPVTHSDERLAYNLTVKNAASSNPGIGTVLTCPGTPVDGKSWSGKNPGPTFEVQWLRNGAPIPGTRAAAAAVPNGNVYTVVAEDAGKSLQCMVIGTSDADGIGSTYQPETAMAISRPLVVEPVPTPAPPNGITAASTQGPAFALPEGTANVTAGSNVLTEVVVARGTGTLASGSKQVTGLTVTAGHFEEAQTVTGSCIPSGTKIAENGFLGSELTLSAAATCSGPQELRAGASPFSGFEGGMAISGPGIPVGARVNAVTGQTVTISANATASGTAVPVSGTVTQTCIPPTGWNGSGIVWSFQWLRNAIPIPGATAATYTAQQADVDPPSVLQCELIAKDSAGNEVASVSGARTTKPRVPSPYAATVNIAPFLLTFNNKSEGKVTVEAQLPAGTRAVQVKESGGASLWSCAKTPPTSSLPSTATCSRSDSLNPGASYPPIELIAQVMPDAPDALRTEACAGGGGAPNHPCAEDEVTGILPAVPFGFRAFSTAILDEFGHDYTQAGGHPLSAGAILALNEHTRAQRSSEAGLRAANGFVRVIRTDTPAGFTGNPQALPARCKTVSDVIALPSNCPAGSAVGGITLETEQGTFHNLPVYAIEPEFGTPAQFAFGIGTLPPGFAYTLTPELRPAEGYAIRLVTSPVQKWPELYGAKVELCSFGVRLGPNVLAGNSETEFKGCRDAADPQANERPFLTLPTQCGDPASTLTKIYADSWEEPGNFSEAQYSAPALTGCDALEFSPSLQLQPTTDAADSPSGLHVALHFPQNEDPEGTATAHLRKTVVRLPEGLVVNPSSANGLGACLPQQVGLGDNEPARCPDSSKLGTAEVETPILDHPLAGVLYIAQPHENPFGSLLALYLVVEDPQTGIVVKLAGRADADPATGRLTTTFDENPQAPIEDVRLSLRGGAAAPLRTQAQCGTYTTTSELTPWSAPQSGPPATPSDSYAISQGAGGAPCTGSAAAQPNAPAFEAGSSSPIAGSYSPFVVRLTRPDGSQQFSAVSVTPPPGLVAKLAGTATCSDSALAAAAARTGAEEKASPSCPADSQVGGVVAGAGAGPEPYYATGTAYLAGPYKGAPLSLAVITPAVAGPFDLGTIVSRVALYFDPTSARVTAKSDPLPTILEGIPLDLRSVTISIDRPQFTLNPTSCDEMSVSGQLLSTLGQAAAMSSRFQVGECAALDFAPNLRLQLHGGTRRGAHPRLVANLTYPTGGGHYANIATASVTLPHSAFLAQEHIRTICTRVQFSAHQCPPGSIYGRATATTPLLDAPLTGPVYLRSSDHPLPDLVAALRGPDSQPIEVELAGRVDSQHGGIRNSFELVPDAPVSSFTLEMQGGSKGLIVNSRDLCGGTQRANVSFGAQNGALRDLRPVVRNDCTGKKHHKARERRR